MLNKRNLDDQSYRSIVDAAMGRLPWICPDWTDHNSHDPGVTVLELMAWYKEMQQYQMNQVTDSMKEKLLKLAGVHRRPAAPAACAVKMEQDGVTRLALSRLETPEGIPFELQETIPASAPRLVRVQVGQEDLTALMENSRVTFRPFAFRKRENTSLRLGLAGMAHGPLRIWFQVAMPEGVQRNPFARPDQQPRTLRWRVEGIGTVEPEQDETHALSQSGYVTFAARSWPVDKDGLCWLTVEQLDPGCEEAVRLEEISVRRWQLLQQETWARSHSFQAPAQSRWEVLLADAMAREARAAVFIRRADGWMQVSDCRYRAVAEGLLVCLNTLDAETDGEDNVVVVCLDALRYRNLLFDMKGLPGESIQLDLEGRTVLTEHFTLWCNTLDRDGKVRIRPWRCVDDLSSCGPRDRVFAYDPVRETIRFGDGDHGAVVCGGPGAVMAANLVLSHCGSGNIPAHARLRFVEDGLVVDNTAASGGRDREYVDEAAVRFLRELKNTVKCAGASDYEYLTRTTPGLRVGAVRTLPGYDPEEPIGSGSSPVVTVVVAPASSDPQPLPDERFLNEVRARLERHRPVCTCIRVVPPEYKCVDAVIRLEAGDGVQTEQIRRLTAQYLSADGVGIGGLISPGELMARLQAIPGVLRVRSVNLRTGAAGCYQNSSGEIQLPRCGIAYLRELRLERISVSF